MLPCEAGHSQRDCPTQFGAHRSTQFGTYRSKTRRQSENPMRIWWCGRKVWTFVFLRYPFEALGLETEMRQLGSETLAKARARSPVLKA
ncbi:hypothetical protein AVEN_34450-1 [Araneus ventricosus]|uniref:Uncharacterized protein n=1 Tax=Araneus ventricosus TaxID=182803 RepID=A0A4Y2IJ73_ARAVE|nr:hypothetical protein AVEN_34450-1 [Araneus ventricosus]